MHCGGQGRFPCGRDLDKSLEGPAGEGKGEKGEGRTSQRRGMF